MKKLADAVRPAVLLRFSGDQGALGQADRPQRIAGGPRDVSLEGHHAAGTKLVAEFGGKLLTGAEMMADPLVLSERKKGRPQLDPQIDQRAGRLGVPREALGGDDRLLEVGDGLPVRGASRSSLAGLAQVAQRLSHTSPRKA